MNKMKTPHSQQTSHKEYLGEITGVKLVNELMVDIMGALIPGVLFLFSSLACLAFPLFCYCGFPMFPSEGGYPNGWFWVVLFLTFLILSYVIGHIFYRSDIKEPDRADLCRQQEKFLIEFKKKVNKIKKTSDKEAIGYVARLLRAEIEPLRDHFPTSLDKNTQAGIYSEEFKTACDKAIDNIGKILNINKFNKTYNYDSHILLILFPEEGKEKYNACEYDSLSDRSRTVLSNYEKEIMHKLKIKVDKETSSINYADDWLLKLSVCYSIQHFQNEAGCATEERCDFPYISYYKYLLKRNETELLRYVTWSTFNNRTKNKINKYKIEIQMFATNAYSILNKNESHIRMAASSWHVINAITKLAIFMMLITGFPIVAKIVLTSAEFFSYEPTEINLMIQIQASMQSIVNFYSQSSESLYLCIAFAFPCGVYISLKYIQKRIILFIHYQRLREIFHTLFIYHQWKINRDAPMIMRTRNKSKSKSKL